MWIIKTTQIVHSNLFFSSVFTFPVNYVTHVLWHVSYCEVFANRHPWPQQHRSVLLDSGHISIQSLCFARETLSLFKGEDTVYQILQCFFSACFVACKTYLVRKINTHDVCNNINITPLPLLRLTSQDTYDLRTQSHHDYHLNILH